MIISKLYILIISVWQSIVNLYDNSMISSAIARICGFFSKKSHQSLAGTYFENRFASTDYVSESIAGKLISLPFTLCRAFYNRFACKIEGIKSGSSLISFVRNIPYIPMRRYGILLGFFVTGALFACVMTTDTLATSICLAMSAVCISMLINGATLGQTLGSCFIVKAISRVFFASSEDPENKVYNINISMPVCIFIFVIGFVSSWVNLPVMLAALAAVFAIILIMYKTVIGIYLFVALSALAPTMVLVGIICITSVSYILHLLMSSDASYRITPFTILIAAFLFLSAFAAFTSITPQSSIPVLMVYAVFTLAFTLMVNTVKSKKQWTGLVSVFAFTAFLVSAYGVYQNFFITKTDQTWVDPNMFEDIKTRVYSTLDNPNVLGQFLIMSIPVSIACMISAKRASVKTLYAIFTATGAACLMFTWSRAAWVGVLMALVILLVKKDKRFIALCIIGILLLPVLLPESMLARLTSIGNTEDTSTTYRISVWTASIYMIRDFWLTGIGLGSDAFSLMYQNYALGGASFALHAHNFYLQWMADMGIGGLLLYILIILTFYKTILSINKSDRFMKLAGYAVAGSLAGYLFQGMAETMWYTYRMILIFWIFAAFMQCASYISNSESN
ncbi:MAG: O-antigen ligase family protein [Clostridia bacterium]|nr:O-antigen ligase family protein [Clostridia bacterium]